MTDFRVVFHALRHWFEEHQIDTKGLHVILNFTDQRAAAHFDAALREYFDTLNMLPVSQQYDVRQFEILGLKIRVESPLHTP